MVILLSFACRLHAALRPLSIHAADGSGLPQGGLHLPPEVLVNVVAYAAAAVGGKELGAVHHAVPLAVAEAGIDVGAGDAILYQPVDEAGVEVVASAYGAHRVGVLHGVVAAQAAGTPQGHRARPLGADEVLAVEGYLAAVDGVGVRLAEHHAEVFGAAAHYVGILQVLEYVGRHLDEVGAVRGAEVDVVVEYGAAAAGILYERNHLGAYHGVDGIERAEHHHVVGAHVGVGEVELVVGVVFVENVLGAVVVAKEGQRYGRLAVGIYAHVVGVHAVGLEERHYLAANAVVARLADERGVDARAAERYHAVKH